MTVFSFWNVLSLQQNNIPFIRDRYTPSREEQQRKQLRKATKKKCIFVSWWQIQKRLSNYKQIIIRMEQNWLAMITDLLEETSTKGKMSIMDYLRIFKRATVNGLISNEEEQLITASEIMSQTQKFCNQLIPFIQHDLIVEHLKQKAIAFLGSVVYEIGSFQVSAQLAFKITMMVGIHRRVRSCAYSNIAIFIREFNQELESLFLRAADLVTNAIQAFNNNQSQSYHNINLELKVPSLAQPFIFKCVIPDSTESVLESVMMILEIQMQNKHILEKEIRLVSKVMARMAKIVFRNEVLDKNIVLVRSLLNLYKEVETMAHKRIKRSEMKKEVKGWGGALVRLCKNEELYVQVLRILSFMCEQSSYLEEKDVTVHCILDVAGEDENTCSQILGAKQTAAFVFAEYLDLRKEFGQPLPSTLAVVEEIKWSIFYSLRKVANSECMAQLESTTPLYVVLNMIVQNWNKSFSEMELLQLLKEVVFPMINTYMPSVKESYQEEELESVITDLDLPFYLERIQTFFPAIMNFVEYVCENYKVCCDFVMRGMIHSISRCSYPEDVQIPEISQNAARYLVTMYILNDMSQLSEEFKAFLSDYVGIETLRQLEREDEFGLVIFLHMLTMCLNYGDYLIRINGFKEIIFYLLEMKMSEGVLEMTYNSLLHLPAEIISKGMAERQFRWVQKAIGSKNSWILLQKLVGQQFVVPADVMLTLIDFAEKQIIKKSQEKEKEEQGQISSDKTNIFHFFNFVKALLDKNSRYFRDNMELESRIWSILSMEKCIYTLCIDDLTLMVAFSLLKVMEELPGYFCHFSQTFKNVFEQMQFQNNLGFAVLWRAISLGMKKWDETTRLMWYFLLEIFCFYAHFPDPMQPHQFTSFSNSILVMQNILLQEEAREKISAKDKEDIIDSCLEYLDENWNECPSLVKGRLLNLILVVKQEQGQVVQQSLMANIMACAKQKGFWTQDSCLLLHLLTKMVNVISQEDEHYLFSILIYVLRWEKERKVNYYIQRHQETLELNKIFWDIKFELKEGKSPFTFSLPLTLAMAFKNQDRYKSLKSQLSDKDRDELNELTSCEQILEMEMKNMEVKDEKVDTKENEESDSDSDDQAYRGKKKRMRRRNCSIDKGAPRKMLRK